MVQHIGLQSETEEGEIHKFYAEGKTVDLDLISLADPQGACIRFIDPYGDTLFNQVQIPVLLEELEHIAQNAMGETQRSNIISIIDFVRDAYSSNLYVRFVGD